MAQKTTITAATFAAANDQDIIAETCSRLRCVEPESLPPVLRRLMKSRNPDVMVAGKWLWATLTHVDK